MCLAFRLSHPMAPSRETSMSRRVLRQTKSDSCHRHVADHPTNNEENFKIQKERPPQKWPKISFFNFYQIPLVISSGVIIITSKSRADVWENGEQGQTGCWPHYTFSYQKLTPRPTNWTESGAQVPQGPLGWNSKLFHSESSPNPHNQQPSYSKTKKCFIHFMEIFPNVRSAIDAKKWRIFNLKKQKINSWKYLTMTSGRRNSSCLHYPDCSTPHPSQVHNCTHRLIRRLTVSRPSVARSASLLNYSFPSLSLPWYHSFSFNDVQYGLRQHTSRGAGSHMQIASPPQKKKEKKFNKLFQPNIPRNSNLLHLKTC